MKIMTLLDTRGLMLRSYHSTPRDGDAVKAWEDGMAQFVEHVVLDTIGGGVPPQNIIACWDNGNHYRTQMFPGYKSARKAKQADPAVGKQIKMLQDKTIELLAYLGVKSVYVPGEEAEDLIALLADRLDADKFMVRTVDNDLAQMVSDRVSVFYQDQVYSKSAVVDKDNIPFELVALGKAIVGDTSDSYGGVPGLGKVKFNELLTAYGVDGMLEIQAAIKANNWKPIEDAIIATNDKNLKVLLENWSQAVASLKLSTLHPDCCYGNHRNTEAKRPVWNVRIPNRERVLAILNEIGLGSAISQLEHVFPQETLIEAHQHEQLKEAMIEVFESPFVSWDYESTDKLKHEAFQKAKTQGNYVDVLSQEVTGLSINYGQFMEKTIYVPFDHKDTDNFSMDWLTWILQVLNSLPQRTVVQNANFELTVSLTNVDYAPKVPYDTAIMASYVDENKLSGLKQSSSEYLHYKQASYEETTQGRDMCELTGQEVLSYGCDDSLVTSHLFVLYQTIMQLEGSWDFYDKNEVEPALNDVLDFIDGQEIDYELLDSLQKGSAQLIKDSEERLRKLLAENTENLDETAAYNRALILFNEWWAVERFKVEGDPEKETALRTEIWEKAWNSCFYQPFESTLEVDEFVSTPTMINRVFGLLCADLPKLKKASGPGVEKFEGEVADHLGAVKTENRDRIEELVTLLYAARKKLGPSARSGDAYEMLADACNAVLAESKSGKMVKRGSELNTNSTIQMQSMLYGMVGLPVRKRSKVQPGSLRDQKKLPGGPQIGLKAVAAAFVYDLPEENDWRKDALLNYRDVALEQQNQSLYYRSYPLWQHPRDGLVHPQLRNCGTKTRRPSGSDPNVLQVSKKDDAKLRKVYKAGNYGDGERVVVSADFANQELVITACESQDPVMLDAFLSTPRKDLHSLSSTGYAHILLPRMGVEWDLGPMDYDMFMAARKGKMGEDVAKAANEVRNKYSKACIAEGSPVLTDRGLIPIEQVHISDRLWDGVEWVTHEGVIYKGVRETLMYDGVTATPDHKVFLNDGTSIEFGKIGESKEDRPRLAVGEAAGMPVRFQGAGSSSVLEKSKNKDSSGLLDLQQTERGTNLSHTERESGQLSVSEHGRQDTEGEPTEEQKVSGRLDGSIKSNAHGHPGTGGGGLLEELVSACEDQVHNVRERNREPGRKHCQRPDKELSVPAEEVLRPERKAPEFAVQGHESALREPPVEVLQELRGTGDTQQVRLCGELYQVGDGEPTARDLSGGANRSNEQRGPLRTWEPEISCSGSKPMQQTHKQASNLSGEDGSSTPPMAFDKDRSPGVSISSDHCRKAGYKRDAARADRIAPPKNSGRKKVYDIVNAGPRHRFTVSGKVVANCNFLIAYLGGYTTLAGNLLISADLAKQLMQSVFEMYARLQPWQNETIEFARRFGYSQTAYGDRRHATSDLYSSDDFLRKRQERQVVNATVQGTAAGVLKEVRQAIVTRKMREKYHMKAVKPVYDEVTASVPVAGLADYCEELVEEMSITPPGYQVGMAVELSIGKTWGDQLEVDGTSREQVLLTLDQLKM